MSKIVFEERAVAFIDVLGFKSVVESADGANLNFLEDLVETLERAVPGLDGSIDSTVPRELIPKHISISDCIILSAPLISDKMSSYCGLSILVMRAIQLTHIFLSKGYLIRGGISIGQVWHTDSNIVGPAYQDAYLIETKTGAPRIELSTEAKKYWLQRNDASNSMCRNYRECFMVNGIHDYYIQDSTYGTAEKVFKSYKDTVEKKVATEFVDSVQYKWWWFGQFLNSEIERNQFIVHPYRGYIRNDDLHASEDDDHSSLGSVLWFNKKKGFGFIKGNDGKNVFVHASAVISDASLPLKSKQMVKYKVKNAERGPKAIEVELVTPNNSSQ